VTLINLDLGSRLWNGRSGWRQRRAGARWKTLELVSITRPVLAATADDVGLSLAEAKSLLARLQEAMVRRQVAEYLHCRRVCPDCLTFQPMKDRRQRRLQSLFGTVDVEAPRYRICRCQLSPCIDEAPCNDQAFDGVRIMILNRRTFSAALVASAATSLASTRGLATTSAPVTARNVVLVHGLFADGSSWSEVIARLQAAGLNVTSVQNPLTTLPDAVASARRVLARQDGPTVFAGHSFSGMIVTEAGVHPNVSALVYVAARAPDAGEDYTTLAKRFPAPPASAGIVFDGDEGRLSEAAFLRDFAGDLPEAKAKILYAAQWPFHKALLAGKTTHAAWRSKPSFYAVSTEDRTINPDLERFMAKRMGAKTIELESSHLSLISHPNEITQLILQAAGQGT